jgi:hypothetical protein
MTFYLPKSLTTMKWRLKIILTVFLSLGINRLHAQTIQLVPDSCTFCLFQVSDGGTGWYGGGYSIFPQEDTLFMGNNYIRVTSGFDSRQPFAIRQAGNKLIGVVADSVSEYVLMDFDANVTDTIHNLYSEGIFYDAVVLNKDSILVNNGAYHHFLKLHGIGVYTPSGFIPDNWDFVWNERGLCAANRFNGWDLGGVLYNLPNHFYSISSVYAFPDFCTTDPLYDNPSTVTCNNCYPQTNNLEEFLTAKLKIFPNPVSSEMTILLEDVKIQKVTVYNTYGLKVREQLIHADEVKIQISPLPEGVYFLKLDTDKGQVSSRFVKI